MWNTGDSRGGIRFYLFLVMAANQDGGHCVKVEDRPKLSWICFLLQVSMLTLLVIIATLWFLVLASIQDGQHYVKVEYWPKPSRVWSLLQVSLVNKMVTNERLSAKVTSTQNVTFRFFELLFSPCSLQHRYANLGAWKKCPKNCQNLKWCQI